MSWMSVLKSKPLENWFGVFKGVGEKRREYHQRREQRDIAAGRGKLHEFVEALDDRLTNRSKYNSVFQHNKKIYDELPQLESKFELLDSELDHEHEKWENETGARYRGSSVKWMNQLDWAKKYNKKLGDEREKIRREIIDLKVKWIRPEFDKRDDWRWGDLEYWKKPLLSDISQLNNPQYIIDEAKKLDINLHDPFILRIFLTKMKEREWGMKEFENIKGLLPQEATSGDSPVDLTPKIKEAVKMFKHMNKPITQESILDELELDERMWKDEYDELLE